MDFCSDDVTVERLVLMHLKQPQFGDGRLFCNDMKGIMFPYDDDFLVRNNQGIDFATEYPKTILSAPSLSIAWKTTSEGPNSPACTDLCT